MNLPPTARDGPESHGSEPPGNGSGAVVRLHSDPINILIVDDEPKNLTVLESVLDDPGYRFVRADSADQALLALVAKEFALLILDVRMPGMTGFELATLIRQRKKTEQVPIIFLTAYYNEDQHVLEGYGSGAVDYLHKPVNPVILRSKVAVFADLYRKSRALESTNRALVAEVTERREAQAKLRELNETLERRVEERTAESREREQALRESDRQKDNFIATLAHELRNPLAPIRNSLVLMRHKDTPQERLSWCRDVIERQVAQMTRLLDDLLDVSRITRSKLTLQYDHVEIAAIIEQAIEVARPAIEESAHELQVELPQTPVRLYVDATRLSQVISNLLINAAKYTPASGRIWLTAHVKHGELLVSVKDTGIGIATEHLQRIFEMFSQVSSSAGRAHGGLGIGLALARGLVELHGGTLSAHSPGPDAGSEFIVRLPLIESDVPQDASTPPTERQGLGEACRVLVVDDLRDNAESLGAVLQSMGHEVRIAYSGEQALATAERFRPHVALVDLGMPDVDGYEVCRRIRTRPWGSAVLMIAQTGWGQEFDRRRTEAAGFNHHLVKPLSWDVLEGLLRRAAARDGQRDSRSG